MGISRMRPTGAGLAGVAAAMLLASAITASPAVAASTHARGGNGNGPSHPPGSGWKRVFTDRFNGRAGSGVNTSVWKYDTGTGIFGTGEIETMTSSPNNVHLTGNGDLQLTALGQGSSWTSGRIQTIKDFGAPAGGEMEVTAQIKQPNPTVGLGYWPAFWMLGPDAWPMTGEIDILEDVNALSDTSSTFHCGNLTDRNPDGTLGPCHEFTGISSGLHPCAGCQTGFHTYTVIVDRRNPAAEQIRWYVDGQQFFQVSESQIDQAAWTAAVDHGYSILFDLAIGGSFPNGVCGCNSPSAQTTSGGSMTIRYVSVYDRTAT